MEEVGCNNQLTNQNWIEKSKTLIYAEWSKFDIHELQIFETYLSRINPRDPESSCVRFTRNEYAAMMGYSDGRNLKSRTLNKWVRNFMTKQISISYEGGVKHMNLFSDADVHTDPETGEVVIDLECNTKMRPVFFNIAETGYISYRRKNTVGFKSEYTLKLYCILKDHAWGDFSWQVNLKELRNMLGATEQLYEKFPEFNRRILKKAYEEINGYTDINFEYEKITRGRLTRAIKFKIKNRAAEQSQINGQMDIYDFPEYCPDQVNQEAVPEQNEVLEGKFALWSESCGNEFSRSQLEELALLAEGHVEYDPADPGRHDLDIYHYLLRKYKSLQNKQGVKSRFGYMKYLVENDV